MNGDRGLAWQFTHLCHVGCPPVVFTDSKQYVAAVLVEQAGEERSSLADVEVLVKVARVSFMSSVR